MPDVKAKPTRQRDYRPNPRRQAIWVVVGLIAIFGRYGLGLLVTGDDPPPVAPEQGAGGDIAAKTPWYKTQAPPPEMITIPDAPLLPEPGALPPAATARAYEEALPETIYEPPVPRPTRPVPPPGTN